MRNLMSSDVEILLATYNGENYVEELAGSLTRQTYKNRRLLVSDDGSTVPYIQKPLLMYRFHDESFYGFQKEDEITGKGVFANRIMKALSPGWYFRALNNENPRMAQVTDLKKTKSISFSLIFI